MTVIAIFFFNGSSAFLISQIEVIDVLNKIAPHPKNNCSADIFSLPISHFPYEIMKNSLSKLKNINQFPFITAFLIGIRLGSNNFNFELVYCRVKFKWRSNFWVSCIETWRLLNVLI